MTTELPVIKYRQSDYGFTAKGTKVHLKAILVGSNHIHALDKARVMLRGDLAPVKIGTYCFIDEGTILHPSYRIVNKTIEAGQENEKNERKSLLNYITLLIGDYVYIEKDCIISGAIGNHVYVGKNSIISRGAVVKECCHIMENTIIAPECVIPPYSIVSGNPARVVGQLPLNMSNMMVDIMTERYHKFVVYSHGDELLSNDEANL